jgi:RNA polymerase sigma factor (sigma-70 family)
MPASRVRSVREAVRPLRSLHDPVDEEGGQLELMLVLVDEKTPQPDQAVTERNLHACLERLLPTLPHRERDVILSRFGLAGREPQTLDEISERLGVTRERVRQIQNGALATLRKSFMALDRPALKPCRRAVASKVSAPNSFQPAVMAS